MSGTQTERFLFDHTNRVLAFLEARTGLKAPPLTEEGFLTIQEQVATLEMEDPQP